MWRIYDVINPTSAKLWFSDGLPIENTRGGLGVSCRLIIENQGFLDITVIIGGAYLDFNGAFNVALVTQPRSLTTALLTVSLNIPGDGKFTATTNVTDGDPKVSVTVSGKLKSLPVVDAADVAFIDKMISDKYIPYQNIPDAPGKTVAEITALGLQFFPFSPYSFQLAMMIYDWTTASFTRLVFMKIFEYTSIQENPYPLDQPSIADMIWQSNWNTYNPQDVDFMRSFLMVPAYTQAEVQTQLAEVYQLLQQFSTIQNRLLSAAFHSMPRTSIISKPRLFSGQMDIYQLGMDRFGIGFLECPLNEGPVGTTLLVPFDIAISTYVEPGDVVTTKMVWSFTDSLEDAMHYSNGIILVANFPDDDGWMWDGWVWDAASYTTPLSDDPTKTEYTFAPRTAFVVQSVYDATVQEKKVVVINLQPAVPQSPLARQAAGSRADVRSAPMPRDEFVKAAEQYSPHLERQAAATDGPFKLAHKTRGRWCRCMEDVMA